MINIPPLTNIDWLTDVSFHAGLLLINYWLAGKEKIIRNYLISLAVVSLVFSYLLKKEQSRKENV